MERPLFHCVSALLCASLLGHCESLMRYRPLRLTLINPACSQAKYAISLYLVNTIMPHKRCEQWSVFQ